MQTVGLILTIARIVLFFKLIIKFFSPPNEITHDDIDFNSVADRLETMQKEKENLKEVENLITDLTILDDSENGKRFTIEWTDNIGNSHSYDFFVFDNENREDLLKVANRERARLSTSLSQDIEDLRYCVIKTNKKDGVNHGRG